jgi:hypothetical protein
VVAGPTFTQKVVSGVKIDGDQDLGTITVERGRSISGRVLDAQGSPVAGARVAAGLLLTGSGSELHIPDESIGAQDTETDESGRFALSGFGPQVLTVVAGREGVGRSAPLRIPRGPESVEVDLVLAEVGALEGTLSRNGRPLGDTVMIANPVSAMKSNFFVITGPDGSFAFDLLPVGRYIVVPLIGGGGGKPKDVFARATTVTAGGRAKVKIDFTDGTGKLTVAVLTDDGAVVPFSQVVLLGATVDAPTMEAMRDGDFVGRMLAEGRVVPFYTRQAMGAPAQFDALVSGPYTACAVPYAVDPNDPNAMMALREQGEAAPMKCAHVTIDERAGPQALEVRVPVEWTRPKP